ncbi:MAG: helix-turn-helix domain-containing protein [Muribaculaceae bacterium]
MDIKRRIKEAGFTISSVAAKMPCGNGAVGMTQQSLSAIISGNPTISKLNDIAEIIGIPLSELVADDAQIPELSNGVSLKSANSFDCPHCGKTIKFNVSVEKG